MSPQIGFGVTRLGGQTMPRRTSRNLTEPTIEKIRKPPKGKRTEVFDSDVAGLVLRISDKGRAVLVGLLPHRGCDRPAQEPGKVLKLLGIE